MVRPNTLAAEIRQRCPAIAALRDRAGHARQPDGPGPALLHSAYGAINRTKVLAQGGIDLEAFGCEDDIRRVVPGAMPTTGPLHPPQDPKTRIRTGGVRIRAAVRAEAPLADLTLLQTALHFGLFLPHAGFPCDGLLGPLVYTTNERFLDNGS
jgi:hypothetical protein